MSIHPNVTNEKLMNLSKQAEQQKSQRANKNKNRILKQTHDEKLSENLSPITKNIDEVKDSTKNLSKIVKNYEVEDENPQTPAIENITGTQSLRDTLTLLKKSNFFSN